ncbi:Hsp20/alpha crystallin family protein [Parafrankia sp. BMG5.11]|uniref:Hsp20/alpha crystallin family protein n=1 Tax=Parafrankia sp. BMG5.11 TaxID=222540 RepID=UPI00103B43C5|nr:Hsp20/alpha crystallin family protein [Parafrankia sp. BMG5.11]TCJ34787.1 Hsp20/alpha crystallin family protein [Parafrankia sp. BMG5.11]
MTNPVRAGSGRQVPTIRWDPLREIEDAWTRMGSLLGDVTGGGERRPYGVLAGLAPAVDVEETAGEFVVELELPGARAEDLSIDLRDSELFVTGEIRERERRGTLRRQTRRVGQFEHVILLPGEVDPDEVNASLDDGLLTVRLAKARRSQPRRIEISAPSAEPGRTIDSSAGELSQDDSEDSDSTQADSPRADSTRTDSAKAGSARAGSSRGGRSGAGSKGAESKGGGGKARRAEESGGGLPDAPTPFGQSSFGAADSSGAG